MPRLSRLPALFFVIGLVAAPAVLAEPVGNQFEISTVGPPGDSRFDADDPRVAFGASGGLVVYTGTATLDEQEVFGRPVDAGGNPSGPQRRLTFVGDAGDTGPEARNPDVAFNSRAGEFLLVWSGIPTAPNDEDIFAQRVATSGQRLGDPVQVSQAGGVGPGSDGDNQRPRVAYNPQNDEYLVVWRDNRNGTGGVIRGQRLLGVSAAETGDDDFFVSDPATSDTNRVDVEYGSAGNEFLVVFDNDIGGGEDEIVAQRVSATGGVSPETQVSQQGPAGDSDFDVDRPAVAYGAGEFLVAWVGDRTADEEQEIYVQRLSVSGQEIGADSQVSTQGADGDPDFDADRPALTHDAAANEYVVTWQGTRFFDVPAGDGEEEIFAQRLNATAGEIGENDFRVSNQGVDGDPDFDAQSPAVAYSPAGGVRLIVWRGTRSFDTVNAAFEFEIFGRRERAPATVVAPTSTAPATAPGQPAAPKPAAALKPSDVIRLRSARRCVSRRAFRIRLRQPSGVTLVRATVSVNGKRVRVLRGRRLTAPVVLRGLPKGRFTVRIVVTTSTGKRLTAQRRYRTCARKRAAGRTPRI